MEVLEFAAHGRMRRKKRNASSTVISSTLCDIDAAVTHFERLAVVALAVTDLARHIHSGQKLHLDPHDAGSLAGLASAARDVKAESSRLVAAGFGLGQAGKERAQLAEQVGVGGRVRARCAADRRLVDIDHLVEVLDAAQLVVVARLGVGPVQRLRQLFFDDVHQQAALARARYACDGHKASQRDAHRDVLEVVLASAHHRQRLAIAGSSTLWYRHALLAAEEQAGLDEGQARMSPSVPWQTSRRRVACRRLPGRESSRPSDGRLVVLDTSTVLPRSRTAAASDQLHCRAGAGDAGLVEDEHAHQLRADLRGQADALRFAAGKTGGAAVERQVVEAHIFEEGNTAAQLFDDLPGDGGSARSVDHPVLNPLSGARDGPVRHGIDGHPDHGDRQAFGLESTHGTAGPLEG